MGQLHKFMFGYLPDYFKINDTYKDSNDQGFVERYLEAFEEEFEDIKTLITSAHDIRDALITPSDILQYLSDMMKNPPGLISDEPILRKLLSLIFNLNHLKGTEIGFIKYWFVLGINATITLDKQYGFTYDDGEIYDDNKLYDTDCNTCTHMATITLGWIDPTKTTTPLQDLGADRVNEIIEHLVPINIQYTVNNPIPLPSVDPFGDHSQLIHYRLTEDLLDSEGNFNGSTLSVSPIFDTQGVYPVLSKAKTLFVASNVDAINRLDLSVLSISLFYNLTDISTKQTLVNWLYNDRTVAHQENSGFIAYVYQEDLHIEFPKKVAEAYGWSISGGPTINATDYLPHLIYPIMAGWKHLSLVIDGPNVLLYDGVDVAATLAMSTGIYYDSTQLPSVALTSTIDSPGGPGSEVVKDPMIDPSYLSTTRVFNRAIYTIEVGQLDNEKSF